MPPAWTPEPTQSGNLIQYHMVYSDQYKYMYFVILHMISPFIIAVINIKLGSYVTCDKCTNVPCAIF